MQEAVDLSGAGYAAATARSPKRSAGRAPYARGERARGRIIEVAIEIFGRMGYEVASTRMIAAQAGVRVAAVHYYFESKAQLYYACLDTVTRTIAERVVPVLQDAHDVLATNPDLDGLIECYCVLQDCLIDSFYKQEEGKSVSMLTTGDSSRDEVQEARNLMRDRVNLKIYDVKTAILSRILRRPPTDLETGLHVFASSGVYMIFHLDETRVRDATGWSNPTPDDIARLKKLTRRHTEILLRGLAADAAG